MKAGSFIIILFVSMLTDCVKDKPDQWPDTNEISGIVSKALYESDHEKPCYGPSFLSLPQGTEYIISSQAVYDTIFFSTIDDGLPCIKETIDFDRYSILGLRTQGTGCSRTYHRKIVENEAKKVYEYLVTIRECGFCEPLETNYNWVLVPRLPEGWRVQFSSSVEKYPE